MQVKKCDRCGKLVEFFNGSETPKNADIANPIKLINIDQNPKDRKTYDLCPDCMKELEDFLNNNIKKRSTE